MTRWILACCFVLIPLAASATERRGLTETIVWADWQRDPTTTLTIHWIDDVSAPPEDGPADRGGKAAPRLTVRGLDDGLALEVAATTLAVPGTTRYVHRAEATGLTPGQAYEVRVPTDPRPRKFRTVDRKPETPLRFALASDIYVRRAQVRAMHAHLAARDPHFAVLAGDIAYAEGNPDQAGNWLDFLWSWDALVVTPEGFSVPTVGVIGNHEVAGGYGQTLEEAPFFWRLYSFPGKIPHGVLDFGEELSLVVLDSGHITPVQGEQRRWLEETLAARTQRTHLFTAWHVPAYPSSRRLSSAHNRRVREAFVPLLDRYGVDASFEGHDHAYKRTQPLRGGRVDPRGTVFVGDGGYADRAERVPSEPGIRGWFSDARWYLANAKQTDHFELVTLTGPERRFEAIGADGRAFDSWVHVGEEPKPVVETPTTPRWARAEFWLLLLGVPAVAAFSVWWTKLTRARRAAHPAD